MKPIDLFESIGELDEKTLQRCRKVKSQRKLPRWMGAVASLVAVALLCGYFLYPRGKVLTAYAIAEAVYPEMAPYPNESSPNLSEEYDAWRASVKAQEQPQGYADGLEGFFANSIREFLSGEAGENRAYAPVNVYLALGMLAELTGGSTRQEILDVLGADSMEALRTQAKAVWNAHYRNDGMTTSILGSSLWLNQNISYVPETMKILAENYYASAFQGEMGSEDFNKALQDWLDAQTGGLLQNQIHGLELKPETVLALATTIYFQAKWYTEFSPQATAPGTFHALAGELTCDFMHSSKGNSYCWGENFTSVGLPLANDGGTMWIVLPDEGQDVDSLLSSQEVMDFLLSKGTWENQKHLTVNLSLPKFDISSQQDLCQGLQNLGLSEVFTGAGDFSPMTTQVDMIALSQATHGVRVAIDEEGVTAAAYTLMIMDATGMPVEDEVDFLVDRPFLFAITSPDGLPLFVGVVHTPSDTAQPE